MTVTKGFLIQADADAGGGFYEDYYKTTAQRGAMSNISLGKVIYNTTVGEQQIWNGIGWDCQSKMFIGTGSVDTIVVSSDPDNPTFITGLQTTGAQRGISLIDAITGTFENTSGRTITSMIGTISFHPTETGGGTGILNIVSERSDDGGLTWSFNMFSLRTIEVAASGESFATKVSTISSLLPGTRFRFKLVESGAGGITLSQTSAVMNGETITSSSVTFVLDEQGTIETP